MQSNFPVSFHFTAATLYESKTFLLCSNSPEVVGRDNIQMQLIYSALFLLIWGEAGNLRFMPECLCYIFHYVSSHFQLSTYHFCDTKGFFFNSDGKRGQLESIWT